MPGYARFCNQAEKCSVIFVSLLLLLRPMQRTIQLILNKLVTTKFDVQINSILKTSINCLCSLFKIKLLIFGPKKFVYYQSIRIPIMVFSVRKHLWNRKVGLLRLRCDRFGPGICSGARQLQRMLRRPCNVHI